MALSAYSVAILAVAESDNVKTKHPFGAPGLRLLIALVRSRSGQGLDVLEAWFSSETR